MSFPSSRAFVAMAATVALFACASPPRERTNGGEQAGDARRAAAGDHSVVIASHLYSTYDPGRVPSREPRLVWPGALEAFAKELERIDPAQVFLLGDNTRNARDEEWELVERVFAPLAGRVQYAAGNHDANHLDAFAKHGGVHQGVKVVGRNKYIQLDCVKVFDQAALDFLARELADSEAYEHVFLLMHYFLAGWDQLDPEGAADEALRQTNWERDVLPLIAGKVDVVFVGDYRPGHVRSARRQYGEHEIQYVLNSFGYGYDEGASKASDGPLVFLELRFEGERFSILPRAVPLDLRHGSYGFDPRSELRPLLLDWTQVDYGAASAGVSFQLAYPWRVTRGASAELDAWVPDPISKRRLEFRVSSITVDGPGEANQAKALALWLAELAEAEPPLVLAQRDSLPIAGKPGLWARFEGQNASGPVERWSQLTLHRGKAWIFTLTVPDKLQGEYLQLWNNLIARVKLTP